ncbi:hypothetical protein C0J52_09127 [Blattella germanica]|nr:hypothetical protein C0J52_09127 [Blattella germanica]
MAHQNAAIQTAVSMFMAPTQETSDVIVGHPDPNAYSEQLTRAVTSTLVLFLCGVGIVLLTVMALSCYRLCLFLRMGPDRGEAFAPDTRHHGEEVPAIFVISNVDRRASLWNAPPPAASLFFPGDGPQTYDDVTAATSVTTTMAALLVCSEWGGFPKRKRLIRRSCLRKF